MIAALLFALTIAGSGQARPAMGKVVVTIRPTRPIVDQAVIVRFAAPHHLRAGFHWEATIASGSSKRACTNIANRASRKRSGMISVRLKPYRDGVYNRFDLWCLGAATAAVVEVKNTDQGTYTRLGRRSFRFYRQP